MPSFFGSRGDSNNQKCSMPVACCCHQCKHWWLLLFCRRQNANESPAGHSAGVGIWKPVAAGPRPRPTIYFAAGKMQTNLQRVTTQGFLRMEVGCGGTKAPPYGGVTVLRMEVGGCGSFGCAALQRAQDDRRDLRAGSSDCQLSIVNCSFSLGSRLL